MYIGVTVFVIFQITFKAKPDIPPSAVALVPPQQLDLISSFCQLFSNKDTFLLILSFCLFMGTVFAIGNIISLIIAPFGHSAFEVAILGLCVLFTGITGAITSGILLDCTAAYKKLILACMVLTAGTLTAVGRNVYYGGEFWSLMAGMAFLGLFMFAVMPA